MTRSRTRSIPLLLLLVGGTFVVPGCQEQLFPKDEPRSQYDRFDAVRGTRPPDRMEDPFGEQKINLRGRLLNAE